MESMRYEEQIPRLERILHAATYPYSTLEWRKNENDPRYDEFRFEEQSIKENRTGESPQVPDVIVVPRLGFELPTSGF